MNREEILEKLEAEENANIDKGLRIARNRNINLSFFKKEISKYLLTKQNEDDWTRDYQCYLISISVGVFETPLKWGEFFYDKRWKLKEYYRPIAEEFKLDFKVGKHTVSIQVNRTNVLVLKESSMQIEVLNFFTGSNVIFRNNNKDISINEKHLSKILNSKDLKLIDYEKIWSSRKLGF